jgi:CBS domain containing-hemolysin-like protein
LGPGRLRRPPIETIHHKGPGVALVRADTSIQDLNRALGTEFETSHEYTTLSGLLMHQSGRIMQAGELLSIDGIELEVVEATPRHVKRVRVRVSA